jgi:hypothetical protein
MMHHSLRARTFARLLACAVAGAPSQAAAENAVTTALERLLARYESITSVHVLAEATIRLIVPAKADQYAKQALAGTAGQGSFEYWALGDKYRVKCSTDPDLALLGDVEYAFDGAEFQFLDLQSATLSYQKGDVDRLATALPNPFFLPVEFLAEESDACEACVMKLQHVRDPQNWVSHLMRFGTSERTTDRRDVSTMRGPLSKQGTALTYRVVTNGTRLERIDRVRQDGTTFIRLKYARRMEPPDFPHRITLTAFDERGSKSTEVDFAIRAMEVDQPMPRRSFASRYATRSRCGTPTRRRSSDPGALHPSLDEARVAGAHGDRYFLRSEIGWSSRIAFT